MKIKKFRFYFEIRYQFVISRNRWYGWHFSFVKKLAYNRSISFWRAFFSQRRDNKWVLSFWMFIVNFFSFTQNEIFENFIKILGSIIVFSFVFLFLNAFCQWNIEIRRRKGFFEIQSSVYNIMLTFLFFFLNCLLKRKRKFY